MSEEVYKISIGKMFWEDHWDRLGCEYNQEGRPATAAVLVETPTMVTVRFNEEGRQELLGDSDYYAFHMGGAGFEDNAMIAAAKRVWRKATDAVALGDPESCPLPEWFEWEREETEEEIAARAKRLAKVIANEEFHKQCLISNLAAEEKAGGRWHNVPGKATVWQEWGTYSPAKW